MVFSPNILNVILELLSQKGCPLKKNVRRGAAPAHTLFSCQLALLSPCEIQLFTTESNMRGKFASPSTLLKRSMSKWIVMHPLMSSILNMSKDLRNSFTMVLYITGKIMKKTMHTICVCRFTKISSFTFPI